MTSPTDQANDQFNEPVSGATPTIVASTKGLPALAAAVLAGLAAMLNGLLAIAYTSRADLEVGLQVDRAVRFLLNMGAPVFVTIWCGLVMRSSRLTAIRLAILCALLAVTIFAGQTAIALLVSKTLLYLREHGTSLTTLLSIHTVIVPVAVATLAVLVSWGILRLVAGPAQTLPQRRAETASDLWAGILAFGFGLVVCVEWIDSRIPFMEWSDFFPSGLTELVKVSIALIFGAGVALGLRFVLRPIPTFSWGIGAPWAASAASVGLLGKRLYGRPPE